MPTQTERLAAIQYIESVIDDTNDMLDNGERINTPIEQVFAEYSNQPVLREVLAELGGLTAITVDGLWTITTRAAAAQMGAM